MVGLSYFFVFNSERNLKKTQSYILDQLPCSSSRVLQCSKLEVVVDYRLLATGSAAAVSSNNTANNAAVSHYFSQTKTYHI